MAKQTVGLGSAPNDGTGDPLRTAFDKCNDNFDELYALDATLGTVATLNIDTDGTLAANSDTLIATQKAVKTAIAAAVLGLYDLKTGTDCSANPNYPSALKGDAYWVTVAGKIGGASGTVVEVGDVYLATADNAGGTQASVGTSWIIIQGNILSGGGGYTPGGTDVALADGGTGASLSDPNADRVLFWDDSAGVVTWLAMGTNLTITGTTLDATGGGGGGTSWNLQWAPIDGEFPTSNFATMDSRNGHPCLDFDTTTQETAYFSGVLNSAYTGAGVTINLWVAATSATTGTIGFDVAFERIDVSSLDIDADSFGSTTTVTATTVPGTSGQVLKMSVNVPNGANMDSLAAGELFRLRVRRDVANDTATGDAELLRVEMVSQ